MTFRPDVQCNKVVLGSCGPDMIVEPGETIEWEITVSNPTPDEVVRTITDDLSWNPAIESTVITATYVGGASGSAPTTFPMSDEVTLPSGSSVKYLIQSKTSPTIVCAATVANCAKVYDPEKPCDFKTIVAPTVTISVDGDASSLNFPAGTNGARSVNQNEIAYQLIGGDECSGQTIMDLLNMHPQVNLASIMLASIAAAKDDEADDAAAAAMQAAIAALEEAIAGLTSQEEGEEDKIAALEAAIATLKTDDAADDAAVAALNATVTALQATVAGLSSAPTTVPNFTVTDKLLAPPAEGAGEARTITAYNKDLGYIEVDGNVAGDANSGIRKINSLLQNGYQPDFDVSLNREGNMVSFSGRVTSPGAGQVAFTLPQGFVPVTNTSAAGFLPHTFFTASTESGKHVRCLINVLGAVTFFAAAGEKVEFTYTGPTTQPWFTAQPGDEVTPPADLGIG